MMTFVVLVDGGDFVATVTTTFVTVGRRRLFQTVLERDPFLSGGESGSSETSCHRRRGAVRVLVAGLLKQAEEEAAKP
jgi:hypothetical protein